MQNVENTIADLGQEMLQELDAIAWFCDGADDGKNPLITKTQRERFEPGGDSFQLVSSGCVKFIKQSYCSIIKGYRASIRMQQFGRQVLLRARALGLLQEQPETVE
jgi:hypothetical protein